VNAKYKLIFGTADGRIIQAQKENSYADFGTDGIKFVIKTGKLYPGQDPAHMKAFKDLSMFYRPQGSFSFNVEAKVDQHEQQGFAFEQTSGLDLLGETFILGVSLLGASSDFAPYSYTMEGYGRGITLTVSQPTADEQIELWGFSFNWEDLSLENEVKT
jgi:hypothetical protein